MSLLPGTEAVVPESLRILVLIHILLRVILRYVYKPDAPNSTFTSVIIKMI